MTESADLYNSYYTKSARIIQEVDEEDSSTTMLILDLLLAYLLRKPPIQRHAM